MDELTKVGYIAVGMEQFPASDEEQMDFIGPIIDESDHYILIVKGRYGSLSKQTRISYTEMELNYALQKGKPVLAFFYKDVGLLKVSETDNDAAKLGKLKRLKDRLLEKRIVKFWAGPDDLVSAVKDALIGAVRRKPGIGWVRGDQVMDIGLFREIERLRQVEIQFQQARDLREINRGFLETLQTGDDDLIFDYFEMDREIRDNKVFRVRSGPFSYRTTWSRAFGNLVDLLYDEPSEGRIEKFMRDRIAKHHRAKINENIIFDDKPSKILRIQFEALGYISTTVVYDRTEDNEPYNYVAWRLTEVGKQKIAESLARRKNAGALASSAI